MSCTSIGLPVNRNRLSVFSLRGVASGIGTVVEGKKLQYHQDEELSSWAIATRLCRAYRGLLGLAWGLLLRSTPLQVRFEFCLPRHSQLELPIHDRGFELMFQV